MKQPIIRGEPEGSVGRRGHLRDGPSDAAGGRSPGVPRVAVKAAQAAGRFRAGERGGEQASVHVARYRGDIV